jgi:hypothetical protein
VALDEKARSALTAAGNNSRAAARQAISPRMASAPNPRRAWLRAASSEP